MHCANALMQHAVGPVTPADSPAVLFARMEVAAPVKAALKRWLRFSGPGLATDERSSRPSRNR